MYNDSMKVGREPTKQGNIHDLFVKSVFAQVELLADFLRWYAEPKLLKQLDLRKIKQEPSHFVGRPTLSEKRVANGSRI